MVLADNKSPSPMLRDLANRDHVYVVFGFNKATASSLESDKVLNIIEQYYPRESIRFSRNENGKPMLAAVDGKQIFLSVSHSHDVLVIGLSSLGDIGVDVEFAKERKYFRKIAKRYFANEPSDLIAFYKAWTAREAFVKAMGLKLYENLSKICALEMGDDIAIGWPFSLSHHVRFLHVDDHFIIALCREKEKLRDINIISCRG